MEPCRVTQEELEHDHEDQDRATVEEMADFWGGYDGE